MKGLAWWSDAKAGRCARRGQAAPAKKAASTQALRLTDNCCSGLNGSAIRSSPRLLRGCSAWCSIASSNAQRGRLYSNAMTKRLVFNDISTFQRVYLLTAPCSSPVNNTCALSLHYRSVF